jgi:hypothetical protein
LLRSVMLEKCYYIDMTSRTRYYKPSNNKKTILIIGILLMIAAGLCFILYFLLAVSQKSDVALENEAKTDLYSYAAKLPKRWEKDKAYYFKAGTAENVLDKVKYSQTGYSWKVISSDRIEWEVFFHTTKTATTFIGGQKSIQLYTCIRYSTSLTTKVLEFLPISCPKEQGGFGEEALLDKGKLDIIVSRN